MLHIVQIVLGQYELEGRVREMRAWLDRVRCSPLAFRFSRGADLTICRVDFEQERDAQAFSDAFDGSLLSTITA